APAPGLEESVLYQVLGVRLVPEQDESQSVDPGGEPIVEVPGGRGVLPEERGHQLPVLISRRRGGVRAAAPDGLPECLLTPEGRHRLHPFRSKRLSSGRLPTVGGGEGRANRGIRTFNAPGPRELAARLGAD